MVYALSKELGYKECDFVLNWRFSHQVFAYNAEKDRLDLCLGQQHIRVQPLNDETLQLAHTSTTQTPTNDGTSGLSTDASFSGAIGHRDTTHSRIAFSGEGRTLSSAVSSQANSTQVCACSCSDCCKRFVPWRQKLFLDRI